MHITKKGFKPNLSLLTSLLLLAFASLPFFAHAQNRVLYGWGNNEMGALGNGTKLSTPFAVSIPTIQDVIQVATGGGYTLALKKDGTVWAWGSNGAGVLGDGTTEERDLPVQSLGLSNIVKVVSGGANALALASDGTVWSWGDNSNSQLGVGLDGGFSMVPLHLKGLDNVIDIACGSSHALAIQKDGTVWGWGILDTIHNTPVKISAVKDAAQVSCGSQHFLYLKKDGTVWAWGDNPFGELGDGTNNSTGTPVQAKGLFGVIQVLAGHFCSFALKADGTVWAWGDGRFGQLGDGQNTNYSVPTQIASLTNVVRLGGYPAGNMLALKSDGTVWTWGWNLGNGTWDRSNVPVQVLGLKGITSLSNSGGGGHSLVLGGVIAPSQNTLTSTFKHSFPATNPLVLQAKVVEKGTKAPLTNLYVRFSIDDSPVGIGLTDAQGNTQISIPPAASVGNHTLKAECLPNVVYAPSVASSTLTITPYDPTVKGNLSSWGNNLWGALGNRTTLNSPIPTQVLGISNVVQVSSGGSNGLAIKTDGTVWGWGSNDAGQLGDGNSGYHIFYLSPVPIPSLKGAVQVSSGGYQSLALMPDGTVWACGTNSNGQLGDGTTKSRTTFAQVSNLKNIVQISAGGTYALALSAEGTVWAWGANNYGQLGEGSNTERHTPITVSGLSKVVQVKCGGSNSIALKSDGTVWTWGFNNEGQLGDGTNTNRKTPVQVQGLTEVVQVESGSEYCLALKKDGTVWAWGWNYWGQVGDGTNLGRNTPVQVVGLSNVVQISSGGGHCLALKKDGTVWAWGLNDAGQLGDGTYESRNTPAQVSYLQGQNFVSAGGATSFSLVIMPRPTALTLKATVKKHLYAESFNLEANLTRQDNSSPLSQKPLSFSINDTIVGTGNTNEKGNLSLSAPLLKAGTYTLKARYEGDYLLAPANDKMTLTIAPANTSLTAKNITLAYGEKKPITATLLRTSDKANPAKMPISFSLDDVALATVKTDANGVATLNYKLEEPTTTGKHTLKASFAGDANHNPSSITFTLTANKAGTHMTLPSVTGKKGESVTLNATLRRNTGGGLLVGRVVKFFVEGAEVGSSTTGSNGVATLSYTITQSVGKHKMKVSFEGDDFYLASTYEKAVLNVK